MALRIEEGLTSIQVVFERKQNCFAVHTIDYICKDAFDSAAMDRRWMLNQTGITFRDFQDAVMFQLGDSGISGAHVTFLPLEKSQYAYRAQAEAYEEEVAPAQPLYMDAPVAA